MPVLDYIVWMSAEGSHEQRVGFNEISDTIASVLGYPIVTNLLAGQDEVKEKINWLLSEYLPWSFWITLRQWS